MKLADQPALPRIDRPHVLFHGRWRSSCRWCSAPVAALIFHREFPFRGLLRAIFIMPMMATPVAVALVWTMMFHPQLGVLNYLLSLVGLPPSLWVYSPTLVIPSLVLVEIWHWTPLVMLIVLGGLAALPTEPYESARLDGATEWQLFRYITLPLVAPFLMVAAVIRTIDALKAFDTIYVITPGRPRHRVRDDQPLPLSAGLRVLQHRQRLGGGRRVLRDHPGAWRSCSCTCGSGRSGRGERATPCVPLSTPSPRPAGALLRARVRARLRLRGFWLSVVDRVAGDPGVPVDAVALAQERDRQHWPIRRCSFPSPADAAQLSSQVFAENSMGLYFWNSVVVSGGATLLALLVGVPGRLRHRQGERAEARRC